MRAPLVLLALLAMLPVASAQAHPFELDLQVQAFGGPITPLRTPPVTTVTIDAPCIVPSLEPTRLQVRTWIVEQPPWATVVVSPGMFAVSPERCDGGRVRETMEMTVSLHEDAPAFLATDVVLAASWENATPNVTDVEAVTVTPAFYGILEVTTSSTVKQAPPDSVVTFPLRVANRGNAPVRVFFEEVEATGGLRSEAPPPMALATRWEAGGEGHAADPQIVIRTPGDKALQNRVGAVTYRVWSEPVEAPGVAGDERVVSLIVTTQGMQATVPGPAPLLPLVLTALGAALVTRRGGHSA